MRVLLVVLALGCSSPKQQQGVPAPAAPDAAAAAAAPRKSVASDQMAHVVALTAMNGREGGTADEAKAADYIAAELSGMGLKVDRMEFEYDPGTTYGTWHPGAGVRKSQNVMAWLLGSDPAAGWIIVAAHMDHLGPGFPGADDDASGIAGVLGVAQAWTAEGVAKPRVSILFVAFGAEEAQMRGSLWFADHPPRPLAELVTMINLDMIGRTPFLDGEKYRVAKVVAGVKKGRGIGVLGHPAHPKPLGFAREACAEADLPFYAPEDFPKLEKRIRAETELRGDHRAFHERGLPYLFFSTSMHDDYHQPTDTLDKIDAETLARVTKCVHLTTQRLAN